MAHEDWGRVLHALELAKSLAGAPLEEILPTLSHGIAELVEHQALIMLTGDCPKSATWNCGDRELAEAATSAELAALATRVDVARPWCGTAVVAGEERPVLAVASAPEGSAGALLTVLTTGGRPDAAVRELVQRLWDLATARIIELLPAAVPVDVTGPWLANSERARVLTNLTEAHAATLTTVLGALRSRTLDDAGARRSATDIAVSALVELRANNADEQAPPEESTAEAFDRMTEMLGLLSRYGNIALEFRPPERGDRLLPPEIARAARTTARGTVLTMLEQGDVGRIRVSWEVDDTELRTSIRDDGPGTLAAETLAVHRLTDRVAALHGTLHVDSVPQWGTIVTTRLPLAAPDAPRNDALGELKPRELEVLRQLALGRRNRAIAEQLHVSEHTVKFHVAKIFRKLGVSTRGEAAALARASGVPIPTAVAT
ncbi:LuxR C-terminal-related transcriptional regulator [Saccharopolyspora sp. NPDC047091]|uniref:helix-turn-helix transcriptional regulator n=1 Tax=Saccharopolyspora sp. NPDC047091 TaxID=3155924 RepID=UPI0033EE048B